jgi:two-component system cell cycle response regulator DivK
MNTRDTLTIQGKRLLLVEDNHIHRLLTEEFFERQGYTVMGAYDATNFFSILASFEPDLIVLDLNLPEIDGFTLLEQLQQSKWHDIPIIIVSAYAFDREKQRAKQLGIRNYFTKPINLEIVSQSVQTELATVVRDRPVNAPAD